MDSLNILLICDKPKQMAQTVGDHIQAFTSFSKNNVQLFHSFGKSDFDFPIEQFDVIILHYSICIFDNNYLHPKLRFAIARFSGLKVVFLQDEYRHVFKTASCLKSLKVDVLYTTVAQSEVAKVYSKDILPNTKTITTLTGFVPKQLLDKNLVPYGQRKLDVVYRARKLSAWYGSLCQEKVDIARKFIPFAKKYKLKVDISYYEHDRIYNDAWIEFLCSSKAALGVESGASVFDFTGEIQKNVESYEKLKPEASFKEIEEKFFKGLDGLIYLNQISPRHFECAALKTLMILFEGNYSGILKPFVHYVPLKKDFSNIAAVVAILKDESKANEIIANAYNDVAKNFAYSFENFINEFDNMLATVLKDKTLSKTNSPIKLTSINSNKKSLYLLIDRFYLTTLRLTGKFAKLAHLNEDKFIRYVKKIYEKVFILLKKLKGKQANIKNYDGNFQFYNKAKIDCFYSGNKSTVFCLEPKCCGFEVDNLRPVVNIKNISYEDEELIICENCKWFFL